MVLIDLFPSTYTTLFNPTYLTLSNSISALGIIIIIGMTALYGLYFGILGWIYINKFYIYPSPPLNKTNLLN
jgi:hypothetical protein